jgi:hypothetical protein
MKRLLLLEAIVFVFVATGPFAAPVYANTFAWGQFTSTNFTSNTVVGLKASSEPYFYYQSAWSGPDKSILFVLTVFSNYGLNHYSSNPGWQILLLARYNTKLMDIAVQNPGDSSFTVTCVECKDGTVFHTYQISRVTNGWTSYMDGVSSQTTTCTCLASDEVDLAYNQEPLAFEGVNTLTQSQIDTYLGYGYSYQFHYQVSPVGTGSWYSIPHVYAFYTNTNFSCTDTNIGNTNAPTWAAVNTNGRYDLDTLHGTTTHLTRLSCGTGLW